MFYWLYSTIMNQVAFHLADSKRFQRAVQNERLLETEGSGNKELMLAKGGLVVAKVTSF